MKKRAGAPSPRRRFESWDYEAYLATVVVDATT
jgi:hypothetical protein